MPKDEDGHYFETPEVINKPMTPDEVVKVLERIQKWHEDGVSSESKRRPEWLYQDAALSSAITLLQDYQKLRERVRCSHR